VRARTRSSDAVNLNNECIAALHAAQRQQRLPRNTQLVPTRTHHGIVSFKKFSGCLSNSRSFREEMTPNLQWCHLSVAKRKKMEHATANEPKTRAKKGE